MTLLERPSARTTPRAFRLAGAALVTVALLLVAACGLNVQTLQPYTPAEGVNFDLGTQPVRVRNLMILSRDEGTGILSATMSTPDRDSLTSVTGIAFKADGSQGAALTTTLSQPIAFSNNVPVILTSRSLVEVKSADLAPGLEAQLTLVFATAGSQTIKVPVVTADQPAYETITPTPSETPSPTESS